MSRRSMTVREFLARSARYHLVSLWVPYADPDEFGDDAWALAAELDADPLAWGIYGIDRLRASWFEGGAVVECDVFPNAYDGSHSYHCDACGAEVHDFCRAHPHAMVVSVASARP